MNSRYKIVKVAYLRRESLKILLDKWLLYWQSSLLEPAESLLLLLLLLLLLWGNIGLLEGLLGLLRSVKQLRRLLLLRYEGRLNVVGKC